MIRKLRISYHNKQSHIWLSRFQTILEPNFLYKILSAILIEILTGNTVIHILRTTEPVWSVTTDNRYSRSLHFLAIRDLQNLLADRAAIQLWPQRVSLGCHHNLIHYVVRYAQLKNEKIDLLDQETAPRDADTWNNDAEDISVCKSYFMMEFKSHHIDE